MVRQGKESREDPRFNLKRLQERYSNDNIEQI